MIDSLNRFLDALPRTRLRRDGREASAFLTCGLVGFYCALTVTLGAGLMAGLSPLILTYVTLVCALSFFVLAHLRRWLTGRERLVQTEHVWFALGCAAFSLWLAGVTVLPYLDAVAIGLCFFIAGGRAGCLLVGCCHGLPSSIGITYDDRCAADGFTSEFVGLRLFPLPAFELVGAILVAAAGLLALPFARPGAILVWFLIAHAVLRFGLEGLRGDPRPSLLGLSQSRWMALLQFAFALWLYEKERPFQWLVFASAFLLLMAALAVYRLRDWRRRLLGDRHVREVAELVRREVEAGFNLPESIPLLRTTSRGLAVAVTHGGVAPHSTAHVSLSLPGEAQDLPRLCELAARAFPCAIPEAARYTNESVLHVAVPLPLAEAAAKQTDRQRLARALYGAALRRLQRQEQPRAEVSHAIAGRPAPHVERPAVVNEPSPSAPAPPPPAARQEEQPQPVATPPAPATRRRWYFASEPVENLRT